MNPVFFWEWIVPQGIACAAACIVMREGDWSTEFFVQRTPAQPPFSRSELARLNQWIPHLQRAIQMRRRFVELQLGQSFLTSVLDLLAMPTLLFDESGRIAHANARAAATLKAREHVWSEAGHLVFRGAAMLFIFDPQAAPAVTADLVRRLFGLTEAEAWRRPPASAAYRSTPRAPN